MSSIKDDTIHGVKWSAIGRFANTIVNFALGIILARLLSPTDYGIVGMTAIFFSIAGIFIDGGFGAALIQKKDLTEKDSSTVFYFNIAVSVVFYIVLYIASPYIAVYLKEPILKDIIRVSGVTMVIGSFGSIHSSLFTKQVNFKPTAILGIVTNVILAVLGVYMAYSGYGVWALVWPNVITCIIGTVAIWFISPWRPSLVFSLKSFRKMFSFGSNLVVNAILDSIYNEGTAMLIGRNYTPESLGYYNKGMRNARMPSVFVFQVIGSVTYPVLAKIQDDNETLVRVYSKYIRIMSMTMFFMLMLLTALARPYVLFLYSDKWEPAIIFVQLFCLRYMLFHINAVNWNLLLVKGRSDLALKKELINKTMRFSLLAVSLPFGVIPICLSQIFCSVTELFVNTYFAERVCGMGFRKQASDFVPYLVLSGLACLPAYLLSFSDYHAILTLLFGIIVSCSLYWGYLWWRKDECMLAVLELVPIKILRTKM